MLLVDELRGAEEESGALASGCAAPGVEGLPCGGDCLVGEFHRGAVVHADGLGGARGVDGGEGLAFADAVSADDEVVALVELGTDAGEGSLDGALVFGGGEVGEGFVLKRGKRS